MSAAASSSNLDQRPGREVARSLAQRNNDISFRLTHSHPNDGGIAGAACAGSTLTQSVSPTAIEGENSLYCGNATTSAETSLARSFGVMPSTTAITCVTFGVDVNKSPAWPVEVRILSGSIDGPDSTRLLFSTSVMIPAGASGSLFSVDFPPVVLAAGTELVVELRTPSRFVGDGGDGGLLVLGCNNDGQTAPTYFKALACGITDFLPTTAIGFPQSQVVMTVGTSPVGEPPVSFAGLAHTALGNAQLAMDGDILEVSNIGSTGLDGVSITLGESRGVALDFDWLTLPTSGSMSMKQLDETGAEVTSIGVNFSPIEYRYSPDFTALGSATYSVTLIHHGVEVATIDGLSGPVISHLAAASDGGVKKKKGRGIDRCAKWGKYFDDDALISVDGYGEFVANAFELAPSSCSGPSVVSTLTVQGSDIPAFRIEREYLATSNWTFLESVGGAALNANAGAVDIAAIDPSANFGVQMWAVSGPLDGGDVPSSFEATWDKSSLPLDPAATMTFHSTGRVGGVDGITLGTLTIARQGTGPDAGIVINADYSSVGSTSQQVIVYDGDQVVGAVGGNTSAINADCWSGGQVWYPEPIKCTKGVVLLGGLKTACYRKTWPQKLKFHFANDEEIVGDGLAVLAENPAQEIDGIESLTLVMSHRAHFNLTSAAFTCTDAAPCPADLNQDGSVDAADLGALLGAWGAAGADLDGNGTTNAADLSMLLGGWGVCP